MGLEAGRCLGPFINDVNISSGVWCSIFVETLMTHNCIKVVTGRGGVKKSGNFGDLIYGRPLNIVLFCIIIHGI
jgi:hypothetical protein